MIYPEPTRDAVLVGNPTVYPPLFILLATPLALLPVGLASWVWFVLLAVAVYASMRIVGVRDWRCLLLAATMPVGAHGLYYGNLTVLLLAPLALAWRYRERASVAGIAVGVAVAAKLFVWPLVVWLLLTRRYRAAAWAIASSVVVVLGAWAVIGFEGLRDYPSLLRVVQDVYAVRSVSLSTAVGALGAPWGGRCRRDRCRPRVHRVPPGSSAETTATGVRSPCSSQPRSSPRRSCGQTISPCCCPGRDHLAPLGARLVFRLRRLVRRGDRAQGDVRATSVADTSGGRQQMSLKRRLRRDRPGDPDDVAEKPGGR